MNKSGNRASSLVITLLVIVVLSTIVVAFMQSMAVERMAARSAKNILQAQLAAESGLEVALGKIASHATENMIVAYDPSVSPANAQPLTFVNVGTNGLPTVTNSLALPASKAISGKTHQFNLNANLVRISPMYALTNDRGETNGAYSYVVQDNASKQTLNRFATLGRAFSTTMREVPLILTNNSTLSASQASRINSEANFNTNWMAPLLTPATFNQLFSTADNPAVDETWADFDTGSPFVTRQNGQKIDLRRFKYYLDSLGNGQTIGNPRSQVIAALLGQATTESPSNWGGGTMEWLTSTDNPNRYNLLEAKQILANLIDYLDEDLHATCDDADNPSYLGVEGRLESDGTVTGHPFVSAMGFGLIFNFSSAAGFSGWLNSTRVLCFWALVNPWSHETLTLTGGTIYQPEIEVDIEGSATGGTEGSDAREYFITTLNERLTVGPVAKLAKNAGSTFPANPSGLSFASFYSLQPSNRQPPSMTFSNLKFVVKKARLRFISTDGTSSYVQIVNAPPVDMNPATFTLPNQNGGSRNYNPGTTQVGAFLNNDPRLNFLANSWMSARLSSTPASTAVPSSNPTANLFVGMSASEGDGAQGLPGDYTWYSSTSTTNHFFVRSPPALSGAFTNYNPANAPDGLAVDTIGEIGYLHSGKPWQTLFISATNASPARRDFQLLDFIDAGTMLVETNGTNLSVDGKINVNTASVQTLRGLFTSIPGLPAGSVDAMISAIANAPGSANYPFVGSADYGSLTNFARGIANKFERESLIRRISNITTTRSDYFTIYSYGEARQGSKTVGRANLSAVVELARDSSGNLYPKVIRRSWK